ncbi:MAG: hypothetical protein ACTSP0_00885 [Alphaproteobacteria bacterium]
MMKYLTAALAALTFSAGLGAPVHARLFNCNVVYDEFDSFMNKDFLLQPQAYGKGLQDKISQADAARQSGALLLHPSRKGLGVAIVKTNKNVQGKFLFSWSGRGDLRGTPLLILRDVMLFGRVQDGGGLKKRREIRLSASQMVDLDTGRVTQGSGGDIRYQATDAKTIQLEAVNGAKLFFPMETLCK